MLPKAPPVSASNPTSLEGRPTDDEPGALVGQLVAERYEVLELLGVGGMGCVYRARHVHIKKQVALKMLHATRLRSPEAVARFEREAVAAARIDHPNVVVATDFGHLQNGRCYLVLEFVQGQNLRQKLDGQGELSVSRTVAIGRQIASALSAAHALGIVHRDLKPENVMLVERVGEPDLVKVLDFGIAKLTLEDNTQPLTQFGAVFGTPQYMSPEQAAGKAADGRSDLYSLGIILYEVLTGKLPFEAADALGFLIQKLNGTAAELPARFPAPLRQLVHSLLEKDPVNRPAAAEDVVVALDHVTTRLHAEVGVFALSQVERLLTWTRQVGTRLGPALKQKRRVGTVTLSTASWLLLCAVSLACLALLLHPSASNKNATIVELGPDVAAPTATSALVSVSDADFAVELERVEMLKAYQRTERDWMLLARGSAKLGRFEQSVMAYQALLSLRADLRKDPGLLTDLLRVSVDPKAFRVALNLSETVLGKHGVDLIWEMWQRERLLPERKEEADKLAKKLVILSLEASPALRAAIELTFTTKCEKLLTILGRAASTADGRSRARLAELQEKSGCGPTQSDDCYACLRESPLLAQASERANTTLSPSLGATEEE